MIPKIIYFSQFLIKIVLFKKTLIPKKFLSHSELMARTLSQKIADIAHQCEGRRELTLKELVAIIGPTGQSLVTLVYSFPLVLGMNIPVLSYLLGALIIIQGFRVSFQKHIWLPKKLKVKKIDGDRLAKPLYKSVKLFRKIEKYVHPRGTIYQNNPLLPAFNGWVLILAGLLLFLKGNPFLAGLGVFLISMGILEEDILWMSLAYVALFAQGVLLIFSYNR